MEKTKKNQGSTDQLSRGKTSKGREPMDIPPVEGDEESIEQSLNDQEKKFDENEDEA